MSYATITDITDLYGEDLLVRVSDHNKDGIPDPDVVAKGLKGADEICDAYLSAQYTVPLSTTPGVIRTIAINIAVYLMAMDRVRRTDEMRQRYEDAMEMLREIAKAKMGIGLPTDGTDPDGNPNPNPNVQRKGRIFELGRG